MTMDFSRLHTYTPPQCTPENTGYTYSLSSSYSTAALDFERAHAIAPVFDSPRMSRRSLRLHTSSGRYGDADQLDSSSRHHGVTYSAGGIVRKEARTVRSRKQQSVSTSESLLWTPGESPSSSQQAEGSRVHSCAVSDASLLSSMLDESCIHEETRVDGRWATSGRSTRVGHSANLANGGVSSAQTQSSTLNGYTCKNCTIHSERKDALTAYTSSSSSSSSSMAQATGASLSSTTGASRSSTVYSRDRSRRDNPGVLVSLSDTCLRVGSWLVTWLVTWLVSVLMLLKGMVLAAVGHKVKSCEGRGGLASVSDSWLGYSRRAIGSVVSLTALMMQSVLPRTASGAEGLRGHSSYCGSVNVNDLLTGERHLNLNGSMCDDCKGKQHLETLATHTQSSGVCRLLGALWSVVAYTGYCVLQAGRTTGLAGWFVTRKLLDLVWLAVVSPGKAATGAFWWLGTGWYQLVTLMSLLNVFILTRCLPKLFKLLLFLLPFLLLLGLWYWSPPGLISYLPAVNLTDWLTASPLALVSTLVPQTLYAPLERIGRETETRPAPTSPPALDEEHLAQLEQRLDQLWRRVQVGHQLWEQQHGELLALHHSLRQQLDQRTDLWVSDLLDQRLALVRGELEQDAVRRDQGQEQVVLQQQRHEAQLAELEELLKFLAARTDEVQRKQESPPPAPVLVKESVDHEARDALLAEVRRLEVELDRVRQDLLGVMGCRGKCEQLDGLRDTVSAQLRQELRTLFYGSEGAEQGELPEPLLQWLSARFVRGTDLQVTLAALELRVLRNLSLQAEQTKQTPCAETVTQAVVHATRDAGMSEEHVKLIVQNALKLYGQDRTGLVDYALESGGGSILSTRCSETFETKTALMSLFGVPLWYFSQSPRVVIQPDVYPGNCWAFKGSQGYLVIRLSFTVLPTAFCLEHIPKALSPTGNISSAPRQFTVYGLDDEYQEEGKLLGSYAYQEDGDTLQTFPVTEENDQAYQIIELRVLSNWGHPEYTCLYRFRVHGEPKTK